MYARYTSFFVRIYVIYCEEIINQMINILNCLPQEKPVRLVARDFRVSEDIGRTFREDNSVGSVDNRQLEQRCDVEYRQKRQGVEYQQYF